MDEELLLNRLIRSRAIDAIRYGAMTYIEGDSPFRKRRWALHVFNMGLHAKPWHGSYTLTFKTREAARQEQRALKEAAGLSSRESRSMNPFVIVGSDGV